MHHREVLAPEVFAATEPVDRTRTAVRVELLGQQLAASDVQHERHAGFSETGPYRLEVDVRGREVSGRLGRQPDGRHAELDGGVKLLDRATRNTQGEVADREQPIISRAELRHCPVQGPSAAISNIWIGGTGELP